MDSAEPLAGLGNGWCVSLFVLWEEWRGSGGDVPSSAPPVLIINVVILQMGM